MKVFVFNAIFQLPDDFRGDINDGLTEIINYRISNKASGKIPSFSGESTVSENQWKEFLSNLELGNKLTAGTSIQELVNGEWEKLPKEQL